MTSSQREIDILIRARYPVIFCVSYEESRVEATVYAVNAARGATVLTWTRTKGFVEKGTGPEKIEAITAPDKALQFISEKKGKACFLLKDFHPYMKDPVVVRKLRDLCQELKLTQKNIILLSPTLSVPPELAKEIAVVDVALPSREDVAAIYDRIPSDLGIKLEQTEAERLRTIEAALGLTFEEIENIFAKSLVQHGTIQIDVVLEEKRQIVQKAGILDFVPVTSGFDEIGGLERLKAWLDRRKDGFTQAARDIQLPSPKGILMVGLPGCGKSLTAICTGAAWKMPLLRLDLGKVFSGLVGSSEQNMRAALQTAESISPCILWVDEIEKGLAGMGSGGGGDGGTSQRVFGTLLTWMQEKKKPVFVLATADKISGLPPELLRKGRFDEIFYVDLPSDKERLEILGIHLKRRHWAIADFDESSFLRLSQNFSGAEIEQALIDARYEAFFLNNELKMADLEKSLRTTVPLAKTMAEKIGEIRTWAKDRAVAASIGQQDADTVAAQRTLEMEGA